MSASRSELNPRWLANNVLGTTALAALTRLAGSAVQNHIAVSPNMAGKKKGKGRQGRRVQSGGTGGMYPTSGADLRVKVPVFTNVPNSVPRNVASLIAWDTLKLDTTISTSTGGITETNFVFSLAQHPQNGSWTTLFDQYCIPQVSTTFRSQQPPGAGTASFSMYTALDFDNNTNIGSISNIEDYSTCEVHEMHPQMVYTRSIKPAVKIVVGTSDGGSQVTKSVSRSWIDCTQPSLFHYGIRSICSAAPTGTYNILATTTIWYAFRNQI
jgi:hypothetical protein